MINIIKRIIKYMLAKYFCIKTNSIIKGKCDLNEKTVLEGHNLISKNVNILNSSIGYGSYIGPNSSLGNTSIGRYCSIAENVKLIAGHHPTNTFVTTHPAFFSKLKQAGFTYVNDTIFKEQKYADEINKWLSNIGNDVWIGANVTILNGTDIGDGVIIAAGAVVVGKLEPYYIYGGVPAKKIGSRFSDEERIFLIKYKWWDKDPTWIEKNAQFFSDIKLFMNKFNKKKDE